MTAHRKRFFRFKVLGQILLCLAVLGLGGLGASMLLRARSTPEAERRPDPGPLVTAETVQIKDVPVVVRGNGTVQPRIQVDVVPQVSGKIVAVHPALVAGGFLNAGETLVSIDPSDYELALDRSQAAVERARVALELERAEAEVARAEWKSMHPEGEPPTPLVLRIPQTRRAEAELRAAEADLNTAKLALMRTKVSLPFNGRILSERVDIGQFVVAGQSIATVYGTDVAEIRVPLEDRELEWLDLPVAPVDESLGDGDGIGMPARISADFAGSEHKWEGRAVRTEGQIDPRSRMVFVVVRVDRPFDARGDRPPLVPGMFVEAAIEGRTLKGVLALPRHALREGQTVWVVREGRLRIQPVTVARQDRHHVYVTKGLSDGAVVVTSPLDAVTDGMLIRTHDPSRPPAPSKEPATADREPSSPDARATVGREPASSDGPGKAEGDAP